jgi:ABC-type nitrate/sulfonate/bicarbonate transport system substrate-binding protein
MPGRPRFALVLLAALLALSPHAARASQTSRTVINVLIPNGAGLQTMAFSVAVGSGAFARAGIEVHAVPPPPSTRVEGSFAHGDAPAALLAGPEYERLVASNFPFVVVANRLQNDPYELVMRNEFARRNSLTTSLPLRRRLEALRSVSVGVMPQDRGHLYRLFSTQGIDANTASIEAHGAEELLSLFGTGQLDAIYVPSPVAELALAEKDGTLLVDPAGGEIKPFTDRMIEVLAVTRAFATEHPDDVEALLRGIAKAEHLVHADLPSATKAVQAALTQQDPLIIARGVAVYAPAVPSSPRVEPALFEREASFYPAGGAPLVLPAQLAPFIYVPRAPLPVEPDEPPPGRERPHGPAVMLLAALLAGLALAIAFVVAEEREGRSFPAS